MKNKVAINEIKEIESQIGNVLENFMSLMKSRAEKILENHQEMMSVEIYEDIRKNQDQRYIEIKAWLINEYIMRFNHELFLDAVDSAPVIPTETNSYVDMDIIRDNRQNFSKYFFEDPMSE